MMDFKALYTRKPWVSIASLLIATSCVSALESSSAQHPLSTKDKVEWKGCGDINKHTIECARIDVPMNHDEPSSGKTFSIPLIRMLGKNATDGKTILLNPGGPGGSGVNFLWRAGERINTIVGEKFNLLSFDPRGVNGSIPQASCYISPEQRAEEIERNPWDLEFEAGEMFTKAENKARACADTMGKHGDYINTPQTATDMNSILDAIGQKDMYYWGFSYGTTLGQTYAQMFPDRVARLIIDGVSNLDEWYNAFLFKESLIDNDNCYAGFVEECFKAKDKCPLNSIKKNPFKNSLELKSHIDNLLSDLDEEPIPVYVSNSHYGAVTRQSIALNGIFPSLYRPVAWPGLAKNLAELLTGNATSSFEAFSNFWVARVVQDETNTFVIHNDNWKTGSAAPVHGVKPIQNYTLSIPEVSRLYSRYQGSDIYDRASWSIPTTHSFYPRYHPEFPKVKTANPILVLSTTYGMFNVPPCLEHYQRAELLRLVVDLSPQIPKHLSAFQILNSTQVDKLKDPVCPLISAKKAYASFEGAGFVEQKSYGHCSISMPSLCTAKHVRSYFNEGTLPGASATCGIDAEYFPGSGSKEMKVLSHDDAELLAALQDLAAMEDLIKPQPLF